MSLMNLHINSKLPRPIIGLTMGDPAGIGPEIIVKAWPELSSNRAVQQFVIGTPTYLRRAAKFVNSDLPIVELTDISQLERGDEDGLPCLCPPHHVPDDLPVGQVHAEAGRAAYHYIDTACRLALDGAIDALVTAPINKLALCRAGLEFVGHTELLAQQCDAAEFAMMLYVPPQQQIGGDMGLGVVHTTLHQSLREALDSLSVDSIVSKCKLAQEFAVATLASQQIDRHPRIAVAAVNPHAGEQGMFGTEELRLIGPAVAAAKQMGIDCVGPLPCDTLMPRAVAGEFDVVVAMYHDQGHIALKLLGMHRAVNVTLGLPIIRTSVAHGTAFEIAGRGVAETGSLVSAFGVATRLLGLHAGR